MQKYYKLSRKERKLTQPPELKFIKLTSLALTTFLITFLSISILTPVHSSSASTTSPTLTATISSADYYLTLTNSSPSLSISATPSGALQAAEDIVNVKTNNPNGYKLYLSMNDNSTNANRLYLNGDSTSSSYFSPTSGTFTNPIPLTANTWGFALSQSDAAAILTSLSLTPTTTFSESYSTTPASDSTWAAVPLKGNEQLIKSTNQANESGVNTNVYYAANANIAQPAGTYQGTILYTAIADTGSTSDSASVSPTELDASTAGQTITITTPLYANASKIGDVAITIGNDSTSATSCPITAKTTDSTTSRVKLTCTAPALAAGTYTITISIPFYDKTYTIANGLTYKQTKTAEEILAENMENGTVTMQTFTASNCSTLAAKKTYTIQDNRDSKTYNIARLDDNLCWMTSNLRLGSTSEMTLTPANTDISSNYTLPAVQTSDTNNWTASGLANKVYENSNTAYGNFYTWYAATASTGTTSMSNDANATSSICPKNWKLPPYSGTGSYSTLFTAANISDSPAGSSKLTAAPYSFVYAGYYNRNANGSHINDQGVGGYYHTSTNKNNNDQYYLKINSNNATISSISSPNLVTSDSTADDLTATISLVTGPTVFYSKDDGRSIRCYFSAS